MATAGVHKTARAVSLFLAFAFSIVAVALSETTYSWRADTGSVTHLADAPGDTFVSSVSFAADGSFLAIANSYGSIELWDVQTSTKLRTMSGHGAQIPSLAWNGHVVSSGCGDGSSWHHDVRVARHKIAELLGHQGEVCGLTWRPDGAYLASGANDNIVNIWDSRLSSPLSPIPLKPRSSPNATTPLL